LSAKKGARIRDKWRLKTWYTVYAPPYFGGKEIASVPAADEASIVRRKIETTLYDFTRTNVQEINIKTYFRVTGAQGNRAETVFMGHEYSREYLRSLVRRGSSRIDGIYKVTTKDGYKVRIFGVVFSRSRLNPSQETAIRKIIKETAEEKAQTLNFDQLVREIVDGKVASGVFNKATKIATIRHVGIRKSKLLATPKVGAENAALPEAVATVASPTS
jgi:small subunit ribosomal protein S3Ae